MYGIEGDYLAEARFDGPFHSDSQAPREGRAGGLTSA